MMRALAPYPHPAPRQCHPVLTINADVTCLGFLSLDPGQTLPGRGDVGAPQESLIQQQGCVRAPAGAREHAEGKPVRGVPGGGGGYKKRGGGARPRGPGEGVGGGGRGGGGVGPLCRGPGVVTTSSTMGQSRGQRACLPWGRAM